MASNDDDRTQRFDWSLSREGEAGASDDARREPDPTRPIHRTEANTDEIDPVPPTRRLPAVNAPTADDTKTRAYDFGGPTSNGQASSGASSDPYSYQSAPPASRPAPQPTPVATEHRATVDTRWMDEPGGPGVGGRIGSVVLTLVAVAFVLAPAALRLLSATQVSPVYSDLAAQFGDLVEVGLMIVTVVGWVIFGCSLMLSGLGGGVIGGLLLAGGIIGVILQAFFPGGADLYGFLILMASNGLTLGAALVFTGIGAHVARQAGFKRAVRLAQGRTR